MAGSIRELRRRFKSVGNIKQITRAMEMVATTKLRRFQDRAVASRPYAREIQGLVGRLAAVLGDDLADRPLFRDGEGTGTAVLVVTSDRGLCGAYNSNILRKLDAWRRARMEEDGPVHFFCIGRKGFQYLTKRGTEVHSFFDEPSLEHMDYRSAANVARALTAFFLEGGCREVRIFYTAFESMVKYVPEDRQLLPIRPDELLSGDEGQEAGGADVILEPDAGSIFDTVVPRYVETTVFNAMLESLTSEFASRRVSMKNATDAAGDMQKLLQSQYNRKRQETITKELLDIVGGAEALR